MVVVQFHETGGVKRLGVKVLYGVKETQSTLRTGACGCALR